MAVSRSSGCKYFRSVNGGTHRNRTDSKGHQAGSRSNTISHSQCAIHHLRQKSGHDKKQELVVKTDRRALSQILLNLANNAIKFTERGEVRIVLNRHQHEGKSWTQLSVHDTGIGIRPEDQPKLFAVESSSVQAALSEKQAAPDKKHITAARPKRRYAASVKTWMTRTASMRSSLLSMRHGAPRAGLALERWPGDVAIRIELREARARQQAIPAVEERIELLLG